ncbi:protein arginine methyltransferase 10 [Perilla frutescens var. hirtella]|nr:protein arginine methyltransferase 10 [Perilla frutescens var. hirtella]KAH6805398.1 protein arginine methyltransferase 10 [Perilla frutescens var. frutescens]
MVKMTKGGKTMNPTDAYRKELHKKELKRNKKERKKVREVGILKNDPDTLKDQIQKLESMMTYFKKNDERVVLEVRMGSEILAIWSAQAGARKVYAVEATKMSEHARQLIAANKLQHVIEVIEGSMEDVVLPEKVDVDIFLYVNQCLIQ